MATPSLPHRHKTEDRPSTGILDRSFAMAYPAEKLSEQDVQDSFHSYLKSSLTQAKIERLIEPEVLASAEADLMITGE